MSFSVTQASLEHLFELKFFLRDQCANNLAKSARDIMFLRMSKQFPYFFVISSGW